jgi:hypothetical protein
VKTLRLQILSVFQLALLCVPANAGLGPAQHWYEFSFHGKKVGFLQMSDKESTLNGQAAHHAYRRSVVMVRRQAHNIRIEATTDAWSTPAGTPLKFIHRRLENEAERLITGAKKGASFIITHKTGKDESHKKILLTDKTYLSSSLDFLFKRKLAPGKTWSGKVIVEEDGELRDFSLKIIEKKANGVFVLESVVAGIVSREWIAADGTTLKTVVQRLGAQFIKTDRARALKFDQTEDIFSAARLSSNAILPAGQRLTSLNVRLTGRLGTKPTLIDDSRQEIGKSTKNSVQVKIKVSTPPLRPAKLPIRNKRLSSYLAETPYESLSDPQLVAQATALKGKQRNSWTVAKKINDFVHQHIENKSLAHAFATASEAMAAKEGDCTEHAVLFSALAKIVGLPTKLITGLVYVGGPEGIFGYHQWVEVWLGDRWVAMDPTFGQNVADPTHIKFTEGLSDAEGLRQAGVAAAELFGNIKLEVLEYRGIDGIRKRL